MNFHFFADEASLPMIRDANGKVIELPLIATAIETRVGYWPIVTLTIRAHYLDLVTEGPRVMFEGDDLVQTLEASKVEYISAGKDSAVVLTIQLGEEDTVHFE